jgi:hypothetical protein
MQNAEAFELIAAVPQLLVKWTEDLGMKQSTRDVIRGGLTREYFANRYTEGWKIVSSDWFQGWLQRGVGTKQ